MQKCRIELGKEGWKRSKQELFKPMQESTQALRKSTQKNLQGTVHEGMQDKRHRAREKSVQGKSQRFRQESMQEKQQGN